MSLHLTTLILALDAIRVSEARRLERDEVQRLLPMALSRVQREMEQLGRSSEPPNRWRYLFGLRERLRRAIRPRSFEKLLQCPQARTFIATSGEPRTRTDADDAWEIALTILLPHLEPVTENDLREYAARVELRMHFNPQMDFAVAATFGESLWIKLDNCEEQVLPTIYRRLREANRLALPELGRGVPPLIRSALSAFREPANADHLADVRQTDRQSEPQETSDADRITQRLTGRSVKLFKCLFERKLWVAFDTVVEECWSPKTPTDEAIDKAIRRMSTQLAAAGFSRYFAEIDGRNARARLVRPETR